MLSKISTVDTSQALSQQQLGQGVEKAKELSSRDVKSKQEMEKATKGFEALLLHEMMKSMWATVDSTGLMGEDSNQAQIFQGMFQQAVADNISQGKGIGVQDFLEKELGKLHKDSAQEEES